MNLDFYPPALEILWKLLKANQIDPTKVFARHYLKYSDFKKTERRVPAKTVISLFNDAAEQVKSPCFGLDAYKYWHPGFMGALGYAWLSSTSLRTGLNRLQRYLGIVATDLQITLEENEAELTISFNYHENHGSTLRSNSNLSILLDMCRINYQEPLNPSRVNLAHPEPDCAGEYFALFKTHVYFDEAVNSLSFPLDVVDKELPGANKQLAKLNDQVIIQYLKKLSDDDLIEQVKTVIIKNLPSGQVSGEAVAHELAMSHRNMQRKLHELGTSFKALTEESRRYLAEQYIAEGKISMTEIAFILGFAEISSFSRAYKRWTGFSPKAERA